MRRSDREMPMDFALAVVDKCEWATLAMTDSENNPYCVTVSIARNGNEIYFHTAKVGAKIDCLKHNNHLCISCVGDTYRLPNSFTTEYESAIVYGLASEITDELDKIAILKLLCARHTPHNMANFDIEIKENLHRTGVWKIIIQKVTGKCLKYDKNGKELKNYKDFYEQNKNKL